MQYAEAVGQLVVGLAHQIAQVLSLEALLQHVLCAELQLQLYVVNDVLFRRGRKSKHRRRHIFAELRYLQIRRTEVITPLRNTMRLIDGYQVDVHLPDATKEQVGLQSFGRDIQKFIVAVNAIFELCFYLLVGHSRIDSRGKHIFALEVVNLVLHKSD